MGSKESVDDQRLIFMEKDVKQFENVCATVDFPHKLYVPSSELGSVSVSSGNYHHNTLVDSHQEDELDRAEVLQGLEDLRAGRKVSWSDAKHKLGL